MNLWASVLVHGCGYKNNILKLHFFQLKSFSLLPGMDYTNEVKCNDVQGLSSFVNFMTALARVLVLERGHFTCSLNVKMHYFFKNLL